MTILPFFHVGAGARKRSGQRFTSDAVLAMYVSSQASQSMGQVISYLSMAFNLG
jgi:hypothetical protein